MQSGVGMGRCRETGRWVLAFPLLITSNHGLLGSSDNIPLAQEHCLFHLPVLSLATAILPFKQATGFLADAYTSCTVFFPFVAMLTLAAWPLPPCPLNS